MDYAEWSFKIMMKKFCVPALLALMHQFSFASEEEPAVLNCTVPIVVPNEDDSDFKKCVSKHVTHTKDWLSQATLNKRQEAMAWAAAALGGGFLTDIPHLVKYATSQQQQTDDPSSHLNDRTDLGTGIVNTAAILAPYVIFAGASFATTAVLISTGQWILVGGVSYLVLNKLFDAAKFSGNEVRCRKMCKVDQTNGALIANVGAGHFKNSITELKKNIRKENQYIKAFQDGTPDTSPFKAIVGKIEQPEELLDIETLIAKFSQANSPTWESYVKASQHCLTNCSTSGREAQEFICEFLSKMDNDLEAVLYFAKLLSASHTNFFSFSTIKNTNLAKFLKATRPPSAKKVSERATTYLTGALHLRASDPLKYGSPENNSCVISKSQQNRKIHEKIKTLIAFQIGLENASKLKEQEMITSAYDPGSCMICTIAGERATENCVPCGAAKSLKDKHEKCQQNVRALMEKEQEHKSVNVFTLTDSQKALNSLQAAILAKKYEEKLDRYDSCLRKGEAILTFDYSDAKCPDCKTHDTTLLLLAQHQRCQAVIAGLQKQHDESGKKSSWLSLGSVSISKDDLEKAKANLKDAIKAKTFEARKELYRKCNKRLSVEPQNTN